MTFPSKSKTFPSPHLFPSKGPSPEGFGELEAGSDSEFPVTITDEFNHQDGRWFHYSAVPQAQRGAIRNQRHINIRSFVSEQHAALVNMYLMDRLRMYELDGTEMAVFTVDSVSAARVIIEENEGWTYGTVKPQSDRNYWNGISVTCKANTETPTVSVIKANG